MLCFSDVVLVLNWKQNSFIRDMRVMGINESFWYEALILLCIIVFCKFVIETGAGSIPRRGQIQKAYVFYDQIILCYYVPIFRDFEDIFTSRFLLEANLAM